MEYQGLATDDLANVRALNGAWLELTCPDAAAPSSRRNRARLAAAPFLLFSLREQDAALWQRMLGDKDQPDLFRLRGPGDERLIALQTAGLGFLWELSRRNPYVARIVSGAPSQWCERIAATTMLRVQQCARSRALAESRLPTHSPIHERLLGQGSDVVREMRVAAQLTALHSLLTVGPDARYGRLRAAACRMPEPGRRVADKV